jgi:hypothetical protein
VLKIPNARAFRCYPDPAIDGGEQKIVGESMRMMKQTRDQPKALAQ